MELPLQDSHANIVDYYEKMRDTHWNPRFTQLSFDLASRLLSVRASCTSHSVDRWPDAQLTLLASNDQSHAFTFYPPSCHPSGNYLTTCHLLKHILNSSIPLETVFNNTSVAASADATSLTDWPQLQQYFSKLRSLLLISRKLASSPPPPSPLPPPLPQSAALYSPLTLQMSSALPLFIFNQINPHYLIPTTSVPLLTTPTPPLPFTGDLLFDILSLTATLPQLSHLPLRLPSLPAPIAFSPPRLQEIMPSGPLPTEKAYSNPIQVVCFKDEAKTRFMCSKCNKQWTSMKGAITFLVIMSHQMTPTSEVIVAPTAVEESAGMPQFRITLRPGANVLLELFPQACADCALHGEIRLSSPKWYPEEVDKVLRNLFVNIHRTFYKNVIFWEQQFDRRRRPGHPTGRHDNTKCIACLNGMCVSAISQSSNQSQIANGKSADQGNQSECSPACKRRLVPTTKNNYT